MPKWCYTIRPLTASWPVHGRNPSETAHGGSQENTIGSPAAPMGPPWAPIALTHPAAQLYHSSHPSPVLTPLLTSSRSSSIHFPDVKNLAQLMSKNQFIL